MVVVAIVVACVVVAGAVIYFMRKQSQSTSLLRTDSIRAKREAARRLRNLEFDAANSISEYDKRTEQDLANDESSLADTLRDLGAGR